MNVSRLELFGEAKNKEVLDFEPEAGNKVFDFTKREVKERLFKGIVYGDYVSKECSLHLKTTKDHYLSLSRGQCFQIFDKGNRPFGSEDHPYFGKSFNVYPPLLKKWLKLGIMTTLYDYFRRSDSNGIEVDLKNLPAEDNFLLDIFVSQIAIYLLDKNNKIYPYRIIEGIFNAGGISIITGKDYSLKPFTTIEFQDKSSTFPVVLSCDGNITPDYDRPDSLYNQLIVLVLSFCNEQGSGVFKGTPIASDLYTPLLELARSGILYS